MPPFGSGTSVQRSKFEVVPGGVKPQGNAVLAGVVSKQSFLNAHHHRRISVATVVVDNVPPELQKNLVGIVGLWEDRTRSLKLDVISSVLIRRGRFEHKGLVEARMLRGAGVLVLTESSQCRLSTQAAVVLPREFFWGNNSG